GYGCGAWPIPGAGAWGRSSSRGSRDGEGEPVTMRWSFCSGCLNLAAIRTEPWVTSYFSIPSELNPETTVLSLLLAARNHFKIRNLKFSTPLRASSRRIKHEG